MSTVSNLTNEQLKKYLEDAGAYEETMNYDDMFSCYKVIKCSENTAQQEQEQRTITKNLQDVKSTDNILHDFNFDDDTDDSQSPTKISKLNEKPFTPKSSRTKLSFSSSEEDLIIKSPKNNTPVSKNKKNVECNVFDTSPLKHKPLDIILYERKYDLPPYCNPKFGELSTLQRAKLIHNFHRAILEKFYKLHCKSLNPAPWGKPIPSSEKFNGSLDRKSQTVEDDLDFVLNNEDENVETQEIYTSRFGRQTKRKLYTDECDDDNKKTKKDDDEPFEIEKKSVAKRQNFGKLSNQDIMKRSKLFSEPVKLTRSEKLFDTLKQNENKDSGELQSVSLTDTLKLSKEDEVDIISNSQENSDLEFKPKESPFIARRVPPPLRGRRGIGGKRQSVADTTKSNDRSQSSTPTSSKSISSPPVATVTEQKHKSTPEKMKCPICSDIFSHKEIEAHASSCGLVMETESDFDMLLPSSNIKKIKCSICDKEMIMSTEYEVHVKECIEKAKKIDKL